MYIDMFASGQIAIHVSCLNNLDKLEHEIDTALGYHPSNGQFANGFEEYCRRQLEFVERDKGITGIYVILNDREAAYSYMPAGTTYLQEEYHVEIVSAEEVLAELNDVLGRSAASQKDFFDLLK